MAEQTIIDVLEYCKKNLNKIFPRCAVWNALQGWQALIPHDSTKALEALEATVVQMVGACSLAKEATKVLISSSAVPAQNKTCDVKQAGNAMRCVVYL